MNTILKEINDIYKKYELELMEDGESYLVYLYNSGYFTNVEIVYLEDSPTINQVFNQYTNLGYAVRKKKFLSMEKLRDELFCGFFNISFSKTREKKEYKRYCERLTKSLSLEYSYIDSNYTFDGEIRYDSIIDSIVSQIEAEGSQMIVLEAPAGFGKTCTSYEVYNRLASKDDKKIAILAELSKNRSATVFRYVLLSEINRSFTRLSAELVTSEIRSGNIILIIDGFDELLHINPYLVGDEKTNNDNIQTMLDTISELVSSDSKAKIILTARKSSIFTGELFDKWIEKNLQTCEIHRFLIEAPQINSWLGKEKCSALEQKGIYLSDIANPVLLTFLLNKDISFIKTDIKNSEDILQYYFSLLLERERERQALSLTVEEQKEIMHSLAIQMVMFGISEDDHNFIKEILEDIIGDKIAEYLERYDDVRYIREERPTEDQFYERLTHHALLDRTKVKKDLIGFINHFIFGVFIGDAICNGELNCDNVDFKFLDYATTAYEVRDYEKRKKLWSMIKRYGKIKPEYMFQIDMKLMHQTTSSYQEITIEDVKFDKEFVFNKENVFKNCIFMDCIFNGCTFPANIFQTVQFYNCRFFDVKTEHQYAVDEIVFCASEGFEALLDFSDNVAEINEVYGKNHDILKYEKPVLEQFWRPGAENAELYRSYNTLFRGFSQSERKDIEKSINKLIADNILIKQLRCLKLNVRKMDIIKDIIGR